jgi:tetratricopeptide (TPR) repeat protein
MDLAEQLYDKALAICQQLVKEQPRTTRYLQTLGQVQHNRGMVYHELARFPKAVTAYQEAIRVRETLAQMPPLNPSFEQDLAWSYNNLGNSFEALGKHVQAQEIRDKALDISQKLVERHPKMPEYTVGLAASYSAKGDALMRCDKPQEALTCYDQKIRLLEEVLRQEPRHADAKRFLCIGHWKRAEAFQKLGKEDAALKEWDRAIALDAGSNHTELRTERAMTLALANDPVRAAGEANELAGDKTLSGERLYQLACVYGRCIQVVSRDTKRSQAEQVKLTEGYVVRALALLVRAREVGFFKKKAALERLNRSGDLDLLRPRADFQKWLSKVEKDPIE